MKVFIIFLIGAILSIYLINLYDKKGEMFFLYPFIFFAVYTLYSDSKAYRDERKLKKQNPELYNILQEYKKEQMQEAYNEVMKNKNKYKKDNIKKKEINDINSGDIGCFIIFILLLLFSVFIIKN